MDFTDFGVWHWLTLIEHELFLFAAIIFVIGALDDGAVDCVWLWLRATGRCRTQSVDASVLQQQVLKGRVAVMVPAWQEHKVIGATVAHALQVWQQPDLRLYVGCYRNDPTTVSALSEAQVRDPRLRIVIYDCDGPTTKADCLNRLFLALADDELREGISYRMAVFHDAEDMVDPAGLALLDQVIGAGPGEADFAQLPVVPLPQSGLRWLGSHYCEEFAEAHGKMMVVRDALGAGLPSAGVGCAVSRTALAQLQARSREGLPFESASLTEDYELGLRIAALGGRCRFVRAKDQNGRLIGTRAYFPSRLGSIVRQKSRWVNGIALQGWDRLGWSGGTIETWMRARDRKGPLAALALFFAYFFLLFVAASLLATPFLPGETLARSPLAELLLTMLGIVIAWRAVFRFLFTAQLYGWPEGVRALARIPVTNVIAIMAGRRALFAYVASLSSGTLSWDKTEHDRHPFHDDTSLKVE